MPSFDSQPAPADSPHPEGGAHFQVGIECTAHPQEPGLDIELLAGGGITASTLAAIWLRKGSSAGIMFACPAMRRPVVGSNP
jgi:hypothetical protein